MTPCSLVYWNESFVASVLTAGVGHTEDGAMLSEILVPNYTMSHPHMTLIGRDYVTQSSSHCIITLRLSNTCPTILCEIIISSFYIMFTHV